MSILGGPGTVHTLLSRECFGSHVYPGPMYIKGPHLHTGVPCTYRGPIYIQRPHVHPGPPCNSRGPMNIQGPHAHPGAPCTFRSSGAPCTSVFRRNPSCEMCSASSAPPPAPVLVPPKALRTSIKGQSWKISSTFGDKFR